MRRILIWREKDSAAQNIEMKQSEFVNSVLNEYNSNCPNMGNKIWFWGLMSELDTPHVELTFYKKDYTIDYINNNFDGVILPDANLFGFGTEKYIDSNIIGIEKFRIPVYIISVGIQIEDYADMDGLVGKIGDKVKRLIDSVYETGGAVCTRGFISTEFCDKCGAHEVFTGGCPSLYQFGSELQITKQHQTRDHFKVAVNGHCDNLYSNYYKKIFDEYNESEYFCQDEFFNYIYGQSFKTGTSRLFFSDFQLIKDIGICGAELLNQNRINLFCNPYEWIKYIADNDFSMSFGSRIHGNIAALLAGVPALLHVRDLRTLDIADFYGLPRMFDKDLKNQHLFDIYENLDYSEFNKRYLDNFNRFQEFLVSCDLVEKINEDNQLRCQESKSIKKDSKSYRFKGKIEYEIAERAFYAYRKYIKKMKLI